jgi:hypothetical protein
LTADRAYRGRPLKERGPKELTGMVDFTRDKNGKTRARL